MDMNKWYTDRMDVYRTEKETTNSISKHIRVKVHENIPCRIYRAKNAQIHMQQTAADVRQDNMLACDVSVDIKPGDELYISRGAGIGYNIAPVRYFAGESHFQLEPVGGVSGGLTHQAISLLSQKRA
jgi:hypothetical protein